MNVNAEQLAARIRSGTDYGEGYRLAVHHCFGVVDLVEAERKRLAADPKLSEIGRAEALQDFARSKVRTLAEVTRGARQRRVELTGSRAECVPKPIDRTDPVAEMRRAELRAFLRSADPIQRMSLAQSDPDFTEAMLDAPPALSGFGQNDMGPNVGPQAFAEIAKGAAEAAMQAQHGARLKNIEAIEDDIEVVDGAFEIAAQRLRQTMGQEPHQFAPLLAETVADVDKPRS